MASIRLIPARIAGLFFKRRIDREIEDELAFHLRMRAQENIDRGQSPEDAHQNARRAFGNMEVIKEASRDVRGGGLIEACLRDFRFGWRIVRKQPGSALLISIVLGVGIGFTAGILSNVVGILFKPPPYLAPERLVRLTGRLHGARELALSESDLKYLANQNKTFTDIALFQFERLVVDDGSEPLEAKAQGVSDNFFKLLGIPVARGRDFTPNDNQLNAPAVCILSDTIWHYLFKTDPNIVGQKILLNGRPTVVAGVLDPTPRMVDDVFVPLHRPDNVVRQRQSNQGPYAVARLSSGVSAKEAQRRTNELTKRYRAEAPDRPIGITVHGLRDDTASDIAPEMILLLGATAFLLIIASANVSNLLLLQGARRANEFVIRMALGAGRTRLVRQLVSENFSFITIGAVFGLIVAFSLLVLIRQYFFTRYPLITTVTTMASLDWRIFFLTCFTASLIIGFFAIVSGVPISNRALPDGLRLSGGGITLPTRHQVLRSTLVVFQVAIALILLFAVVRARESFRSYETRDPSFVPSELFEIEVPFIFESRSNPTFLMDELISAIRAIPGISSATYSSTGLMDIMTCRYRINNGSARCACLSVVDPGYFATVKASLVKGSGFTARRDSHAPIISAIVDEAFVRAELQNQNPIGSKLSLEIAGEQLPIEIIGVTQHLNQYGMDRPEFIHPQIYLPLQQIPSSLAPIVLSQMKLFIRTDKSFAELRPAVKGVVQQFDRGQSVTLAKSIDMLLRLYGGHRLFSLGSFFIFATVSLLLVIVSIRSLIAYTIDERSHEIAIRIALGARRMELYQLVASKALRLIVIGGAIGVGATLLLRQFVYRYQEGENWDPQGIALVLALFAFVAFASCYVSARRATLLDPNQLLRTN